MPPESEIEAHVSAYAKSVGVLSYKFVCPSNRGVPDRIYLYRGHTLFIEFKRTGRRTLDPLQEEVRKRFLEQGFKVPICNDKDKGKRLIDKFKGEVDSVKP